MTTPKMNDQFFIEGYKNTTAKIGDIKKRYWLFIIALAASHTHYLSNNDLSSLITHITIAVFLLLCFLSLFNSLNDERIKLKKYNDYLRQEDFRLGKLITEEPCKMDLGDYLMPLAGIVGPLASIAVVWHFYCV